MTAPNLRDYQIKLKQDVRAAWNNGARDVCAVLPTGGGKTVTFADIMRENSGPSVAIAHRSELVSQISIALARYAVPHRIVGSRETVKNIVRMQTRELGRTYYDPSAPVGVASVDTIRARVDSLGEWARRVDLVVNDEGHHMLEANKWGTARALFSRARGLGVTATPLRADGKGLGRHADGLYDALALGPTMRELIDRGYLTDYRIYAPPSDIDLSSVNVTAGGDYNRDKLTKAVRKSRIVGDIVGHYTKIAAGRTAICFVTDVETAEDVAAQFTAAGIPAAAVSAKTPDAERAEVLRRLRERELRIVVNVDLFGEGFDAPAIEVVIMARPTQSYGLYVQQFGRGLRLLEGKQFAIIIDHVGNVVRHGLPDAPRQWTLDRRTKRGGNAESGGLQLRACPQCTRVYEAFYKACPACGFAPVPTNRSAPEYVDGDLTELSPEVLAKMRGEVARVDLPLDKYREQLNSKGVPYIGQLAHVKRHAAKQDAQAQLRDAMALWAGYQRAEGRPDAESYRLFYHTFKIDVLSAQALGTKDAEKLLHRIQERLS